MKKFNDDIKSDFVFKGAQLSLENAGNHFEAGEILAGKEKFGLAVSHIILAAEECAKSMMLLVKYNEEEINKSDISIAKIYNDYDFSKLFYSHKPKQNLAIFVSIFSQVIAELSPWPISVLDKVIFKGEELNDSDIKKIVETQEKQAERIEAWNRNDIIPDLGLEKHSEWWKRVNDNKNNGLYVGLNDKDQWRTPEDFTQSDYQIAHDNVSRMIALLDRYLEMQDTIDSYDPDLL